MPRDDRGDVIPLRRPSPATSNAADRFNGVPLPEPPTWPAGDDDIDDGSEIPTDVEAGIDQDFARDEKGRIYVSQTNIMLAVRKLGVAVSRDMFAREDLIAGLPGHGPRLDDAALRELRWLIDERFGLRVPRETFDDVVARYAHRARRHPVREYLDALTWDGTPRIDRWLVDYASAADTAYVRAVSRLVLVAAVRRIRQPGAKFDEMLIVESRQGTNKSTALRTLSVRDEWFADDLPLDGDTKHLLEQTSGKWIVEAGELKGMSKGDVAKLKACLSRQNDEARMSYDRRPTKVPRQFVIIGTTNETAGYLKDQTGNRRFWPVAIQSFDVDRLRADRDQLWAEAAAAEASGESIRLDPSLYEAAEEEQADRETDDDPMEVVLREALGDRRGKIRTLDVWAILNIEPGRATQDQNARMGAAMRRLGWTSSRLRFSGEREYCYLRGTDAEREHLISVDVVGANGSQTAHVSGGVQ